MEEWREAARKFLEEWKEKDFVEGALATGSYVAGNPSEFSDVDIHVVLSEGVGWRERGNKVVSGFLIEYFANPVETLREEFGSRLEDNRKVTERMFHIGEILFDKKRVVEKLKEEAKEWMEEGFEPLDENEIEQAKYGIWNDIEDLKDRFREDRDAFRFFSNIVIRRIYKRYAKYLQAEVYNSYRLLKVLEDKEFRENYHVDRFPDHEFADKCAACIREKEDHKKLELIQELADYVLEKMGGFEIDGWKLREDIE